MRDMQMRYRRNERHSETGWFVLKPGMNYQTLELPKSQEGSCQRQQDRHGRGYSKGIVKESHPPNECLALLAKEIDLSISLPPACWELLGQTTRDAGIDASLFELPWVAVENKPCSGAQRLGDLTSLGPADFVRPCLKVRSLEVNLRS